jgi:xanthine dehydrogenase accessory factor
MANELDLLIRAASDRREPMAIATVVATWGSAPRPVGSHMLVDAEGHFEGSVSGGCVEGEVLHAAAEAIGDGKSRLLRFGVDDENAWEVGLPCGGEIMIFVQPLTDEGFGPGLIDAIADARAKGEPIRVTTDLVTGKSAVGAEPGPDRFVNEYLPPRRLLIVGAVAIAQALVRLTPALGATPVVIDPRARFLTEERFPGVARDDRWPDEAIRALKPDPASAVITLSHDPKIDDPALIAALASNAGYVAALGSRRSHAARIERLAAAGVAPEAIARIDAPAGIPIGAIGPAEIALSIAAAMVKAFRQP